MWWVNNTECLFLCSVYIRLVLTGKQSCRNPSSFTSSFKTVRRRRLGLWRRCASWSHRIWARTSVQLSASSRNMRWMEDLDWFSKNKIQNVEKFFAKKIKVGRFFFSGKWKYFIWITFQISLTDYVLFHSIFVKWVIFNDNGWHIFWGLLVLLPGVGTRDGCSSPPVWSDLPERRRAYR